MLNQQKLNLSLKLSLTTMIILGVLNLIGSNFLATQGHELQNLNREYRALQKENSHLKNQIATEVSLASLETWADAQGYVKIHNPLALTAPAPVAYVSQ